MVRVVRAFRFSFPLVGSIPTLHLAAKIHALYKKGMSSSKEQTNGIEKDPTQIIPEPELSQTDCESEFSDCSLEIDEELDSLSQANYPRLLEFTW